METKNSCFHRFIICWYGINFFLKKFAKIFSKPQIISASYYSQPGVVLSPWVWTGFSDLILTKRIWKSWQDITTMTRLQEILPSILLTESLAFSVCMLWRRKLPYWRSLCGKKLRAAPGPHPWRSWTLPTAMCMNRKANGFPNQTFRCDPQFWLNVWLQSFERLWTKGLC